MLFKYAIKYIIVLKLFFKVFNICFHNLFSIRYCVTTMTGIFQYYCNGNLWVFSRSKGYEPSVVITTCIFSSTGFSSYCNFTGVFTLFNINSTRCNSTIRNNSVLIYNLCLTTYRESSICSCTGTNNFTHHISNLMSC